MSPIPPSLRRDLAADPEYKVCMKRDLPGHTCDGRITWDHAVIYAGRQLQKRWAILAICAFGHSVDWHQNDGDLNKEVHLWIALNRATDAELFEISKAIPYLEYRERLNKKYGPYRLPKVYKPVDKLLITV